MAEYRPDVRQHAWPIRATTTCPHPSAGADPVEIYAWIWLCSGGGFPTAAWRCHARKVEREPSLDELRPQDRTDGSALKYRPASTPEGF